MTSLRRLSSKHTRLKGCLNDAASPATARLLPPRVLGVLPAVILVAFILLLRQCSQPGSFQNALQTQDTVVHTLVKRGHHLNATIPGGISHDVPSYIPYHNLYIKLPPWLGISLLVLWLCFLFSFLGIVASDFFCPNLSTLASRLGLPEDVAGATMVGWANGAPDLFSTFASLKAGSGSLAIGELIGAASFICCVVAGSMVLVKPFKVKKFHFFRDVGFFTLAVAFSIIILRDGRIVAWESRAMIGLYVAYVVLVAAGSWIRRRQWRKKERERLIRDAWNENVTEVPPYRETDPEDAPAYLDESMSSQQRQESRTRNGLPPLTIPSLRLPPSIQSPSLQAGSEARHDYFSASPAPMSGSTSTSRQGTPLHSPLLVPLLSPAVSTGVGQSSGRKRSTTLSGQATPTGHGHKHSHGRSASHHHIHTGGVPHLQGRMSFLGAIEFRDVVNSLQAESSAQKHLAAFEAPQARPSKTDRMHSYHVPLPDTEPELGLGMARNPSSNTMRKADTRQRARSRSPHAAADVPDEHGHTRSFPDACFDDPWRGAEALPPSIQVSQPSSSNIAALKSPEWGNGLGDRDSQPDDDASPGDSDITARPGDASSPKAQKGAMGRFPSKALHVLGLGASADNGTTPPPKAQRVLGLDASDGAISSRPAVSRATRFFAVLRAMIYAIFPTLHNFRSKSFLAMLTSLISVPAVLLLNLTLPVVDESGQSEEDEQVFLEELEKDRLEAEPEGQIRLDLDAEEAGETVAYNDHGSRDVPSRRSTASTDLENDSRNFEDAIQDRLDGMEEEQHERDVRRAVAVAHELHSPVATAHHHTLKEHHHRGSSRSTHRHAHDKHASYSRSSSRASLLVPYNEEDGHLAPPGGHSGADTPTLSQPNDITTGAAAVPALVHLHSQEDSLDPSNLLGTSGKYTVDPADLTHYLTVLQCLLAPPFAVAALLGKAIPFR